MMTKDWDLDNLEEMKIKDYIYLGDLELEETCMACPEQYDVLYNNHLVGYMRLRHGYFTTSTMPGSEPLYESNTDGDGIFEEYEREYHINKGMEALVGYYNKQSKLDT